MSDVQKFTYTWINVEGYSTAAEFGSVGHPCTVFNVQKKSGMVGGGEVQKRLRSRNPTFPITSMHSVVFPSTPSSRPLTPAMHEASLYIGPKRSCFSQEVLTGLDHSLTFSRLMTYIYIYIYIYIYYMSYCTANLQMLHFIYLFNKYTY